MRGREAEGREREDKVYEAYEVDLDKREERDDDSERQVGVARVSFWVDICECGSKENCVCRLCRCVAKVGTVGTWEAVVLASLQSWVTDEFDTVLALMKWEAEARKCLRVFCVGAFLCVLGAFSCDVGAFCV